mmetsp:Transcript_5236/g.6737  ORF Transcript_5236/g.6737 Transcript_5236/m.6737 type:complete len:530 (+) Transcript_5236:72-1661(+)
MDTKEKDHIKSLPGNDKCLDCQTPNPTWGSISHGSLHCFECIGKHRGLGVHISFARSLDLDSWSDQQLKYLQMGGNEVCLLCLKEKNVDVEMGRENIRKTYESDAALLYRAVLKARVEGRPEPKKMQDIIQDSSRAQSTKRNESDSKTNTTLTSHYLTKTIMLTPTQRFILGFKYWSYHCVILPLKSYRMASTTALVLYITNKIITKQHPQHAQSSILSYFFSKLILSTATIIFTLSFGSMHWFQKHRHEAFKSATNNFASKLSNGRIKRNSKYDLYFPPNVSIGSTIPKGFIFYPESLIDIMSYSTIMSKLSDAGILVIVANFESKGRLVSPYTGAGLNDLFQIVYGIETLLGMNVNEWILGGHGDGCTSILELKRLILKNKMMKSIEMNEEKGMRCICWGITFSSLYFWTKSIFVSKQKNDLDSNSWGNILFINGSNDFIANQKKVERLLKQLETTTPIHNNQQQKLNIQRWTIGGGNHSGFAHFGPQTFPWKDGNCVKTIDLQQKECLIKTLDFIFEREPICGKDD